MCVRERELCCGEPGPQSAVFPGAVAAPRRYRTATASRRAAPLRAACTRPEDVDQDAITHGEREGHRKRKCRVGEGREGGDTEQRE